MFDVCVCFSTCDSSFVWMLSVVHSYQKILGEVWRSKRPKVGIEKTPLRTKGWSLVVCFTSSSAWIGDQSQLGKLGPSVVNRTKLFLWLVSLLKKKKKT